MKLIRNTCLIFYLLNSILFANNTEINVTPNITTIGNPIVVTLETKDAIIKIPNDNSLKPFQVLNKTQEKFKISWTLASYKTGEQFIPTLNITTEKGAQQFQKIPVTINTTKTDSIIEPIIGGIELPKPWAKWALYGLIIIISCIGLLSILNYVKRRKTSHTNKHLTKKQDPIDIAIRKLEKLNPNNTNISIYFLNISTIIKQYLSDCLSIQGIEMTSEELLSTIIRKKYNKEQVKRFRYIFNYCDTVKFFKMTDIDTNFTKTTVIPFLKSLKGSINDI